MHHDALTVTVARGALPHERKYYQVVGFTPPTNYLVHNSSINNLLRGVLTRVFYAKGKLTPRPVAGIYRERVSYFRDLLCKRFRSTTPISYDEFLKYYKGRRLTLYTNAVNSLLTQSICSRDSHVRAFVKAEFINSDAKTDPDPRVISPRDPRYNVELGRYLRPIEHQIYSVIGKIFGEPTVLKGYNANQIGKIFHNKWKRYRNPVAIGLDASRFDQHVSIEALEWEHSCYNRIYKSKELSKLLKMQLRNKVKGYCRDGKLKYTTEGCRMSGDINTALGNCLLMCALVHAYSKEKGISISLANNGDDCTVIMECSNLVAFQSDLSHWFSTMGFTMKIEDPVYCIEGIEFCQTHPVFVDDSYIMVRNYPQAIAKDTLSLRDLSNPRICKRWMMAVGEGGLSLTGGIPVYQSFYSNFYRAGSLIEIPTARARKRRWRDNNMADVEITGGLSWLSKGMCRKYGNISPKTRHSFYLAFGCTPDQQIAIESYYNTIDFKHDVVNFGRQVNLPGWF